MKKIISDIQDSNKKTNESMLAEIKKLGMTMGGAVLIEEKKLEKILEKDSKSLSKTIEDKVGEELKKINKTLLGVKKGLTGVESKNFKDSTTLGKSEQPVSFKEKLMSTVGGIRARSEATKEFFKSPIKNIKEAVGGFASNIQNKAYQKFQDIGDVLSAPAGYNPEKEQFAKDYGLRTPEGRARDQARRDEMRERINKAGYDKKEAERRLKEVDEYVSEETMAEGRKRYEATKGAQQEVAAAKSDIEAAGKRGFEATSTEQARLETAKTNLAAVDPRVKEAEQNLKEVKAEDRRATEKENDDNVVTSQEAMAKSMQDNNVIISELLETTKIQLDSVKKISDSLSPKEPVDLDLQYQPVTKKLDELITTVKEKEFTAAEGGGGSLLDSAKDLLGGKGGKDGKGGKGKPGASGKGAAAAGRFGKLATIGKIGGAALAVAGGAYTAFSGYSDASDEQEAAIADIESKKKSGELTAEQADAMTKQVNEKATEKKGGAIGEGAGMAAGGLAGMKLGAALGSFAGPVGTVVGGVAGGAIGAFAGSSLGKKAGEFGGKVMNFFSGDKKQEVPQPAGTPTTSETKTVTKIADEPVVPGQPLSEKQMAVIGMSKSMGNSYSPEIEAQYAKQKSEAVKPALKNQPSSMAPVTPGTPKSEGIKLANASTENADMVRESSKAPAQAPVIMNNTTNNTSGGGTPVASIKATPRSYSGSPLDRHLEKVSSF